jgi:hypothetical protein
VNKAERNSTDKPTGITIKTAKSEGSITILNLSDLAKGMCFV